jgi:tetratricopeptide (TPR) repeat protein
MHRRLVVVLASLFVLVGCASHAPVKHGATITLAVDKSGTPAADADQQKVYDALAMIQAGHIQQAVDGPLAEVIGKYESLYKDSPAKVFCARGMVDALAYAALGDTMAKAGPGRSVTVIGPAWALAYWARGYAFTEMARYAEARAELEKALALSPMDSQYKIELAYTYQHSGDWKRMLSLDQEAEAEAEISAAPEHASALKCAALRGQGFALVELHRLDEATQAYRSCLKLTPGEPKSLGELEYIRGLRAK